MEDLRVTERIRIPAACLELRTSRSGGPGGQNLDKVETKVTLVLRLDACGSIPPEVRARLREIAGGRIDAGGRLRVASSEHRSRERNLRAARARLAELLPEWT
jgi:ribosome-associated protein